MRARIAALTGLTGGGTATDDPEVCDTSRMRDRLRRLGSGDSRVGGLDAPEATRPDRERDSDDQLVVSPAGVDRASGQEDVRTRKARPTVPLTSLDGARVVGEGDVRYLRIDRALDETVRDAALHWLHKWDHGHAQLLSRDDRLRAVDPARALFIDTETTGLGGASSLVFLIGCVHWKDGRLHLTQFFLFGPPAERRMMADLLTFFDGFEFLVSYNGRAFDVRALCDRFTLNGLSEGPPTLEAFPHMDLLHPARRIWRHALEDCRLATIERTVLGRPRINDVDGARIPMIYYNYLRSGRTRDVHRVIRHNECDTVSLALLGASMMWMLSNGSSLSGDGCSLSETPHGRIPPPHAGSSRYLAEQHIGLSRLHTAHGDPDRAEEAMLAGLDGASPVSRYMARKRLAALHKKRGDPERALPLWRAMVDENVLGETHPYTELAKYHEHRSGDYQTALTFVLRAMRELFERRSPDQEWDQLLQRRRRLEQKIYPTRTAVL